MIEIPNLLSMVSFQMGVFDAHSRQFYDGVGGRRWVSVLTADRGELGGLRMKSVHNTQR